uniref:Uncharacterized protein n=1 Tax=Haptolina brevifila TaxID=156173 RepID=A0A7S2ITF7_9EUKA|mmetsp:Transcript_71258/g.141283  ORF Transcript_71258/g.141283 Transcript_71258/m.141283 type:complete len:110 (+) Transcript_71258:332-661(+)
MLIDFLICRQPMYLVHIYLPIAYALSFVTFTGIYYAAGGVYHQDRVSRYIYSVLDWGDPAATGRLTGLIVLIAVPFFWCIFVCIFLGRRACTRKTDLGQIQASASKASA